jgi:hypothetical protein
MGERGAVDQGVSRLAGESGDERFAHLLAEFGTAGGGRLEVENGDRELRGRSGRGGGLFGRRFGFRFGQARLCEQCEEDQRAESCAIIRFHGESPGEMVIVDRGRPVAGGGDGCAGAGRGEGGEIITSSTLPRNI